MVQLFQALLDDCTDAGRASVVSVICKPKSKWRPVALDTIELEKIAVRKLKLNAKNAMSIAEKLYSQGKFGTCCLLSYSRYSFMVFCRVIGLSWSLVIFFEIWCCF